MDATVERNGPEWTLIFIRDLGHPPERVWTALTDPAEIDRWAPFAADRPLTATGDVTLTVVDGDQRTDTAGTVLTAEAPRLLEHTWGEDRLRWELEPTPAGTRLTLRHTSANPGVEAMVAAGWHLCAGVLGALLDGRPVPVIRGRDALDHGWVELRDAYAKQFTRAERQS